MGSFQGALTMTTLRELAEELAPQCQRCGEPSHCGTACWPDDQELECRCDWCCPKHLSTQWPFPQGTRP